MREDDMLTYCKRCVMPHSKPDIYIDENGICSACRTYEKRKEIDWDKRMNQLLDIFEKYKQKGTNWDCIVPVSGGKDSTYQVLKILKLGFTPLCVTATTCDPSEIGKKNIENVKRLGVDYVEFSPNPIIRAKLNRIGLMKVGDISWPEHLSIFTLPVRVAVQYNIPLIIWGENSQNEYGGPASATENNVLNRRWLDEFGGLLGLRICDLTTIYGIEPRYLLPYQYPLDEDMNRIGVTGLFLGYYFPWDGLSNAIIAQAYGLTTYGKAIEGSMVDYENLDNYQTGIHDYFKFLKFGFSRTTDIASLHIRRGRISRSDAIEIVRERDGKFPWSYLGKPLQDILERIDMTVEEFITICDKFTNNNIFRTDSSGMLIKDKYGNLEKINYDNL